MAKRSISLNCVLFYVVVLSILFALIYMIFFHTDKSIMATVIEKEKKESYESQRELIRENKEERDCNLIQRNCKKHYPNSYIDCMNSYNCETPECNQCNMSFVADPKMLCNCYKCRECTSKDVDAMCKGFTDPNADCSKYPTYAPPKPKVKIDTFLNVYDSAYSKKLGIQNKFSDENEKYCYCCTSSISDYDSANCNNVSCSPLLSSSIGSCGAFIKKYNIDTSSIEDPLNRKVPTSSP